MEVSLIAEPGEKLVQCGGEQIPVRPGEPVHLLMRGGDDFGLVHQGSQAASLTELWLTSDEWSGPARISRQRWDRPDGILASWAEVEGPAMSSAGPARIRFLQAEAPGRISSGPLASP